MPSKRPTKIRLGEVSVIRAGFDAIIDHADPDLPRIHIAVGPGIAEMTDAAIVSMYNELREAQWTLLQEQGHTVVQEPPGAAQIDYHENSGQWVPRGELLRCLVDDGGADGEVTVRIDDWELSLKEFGRVISVYAGWGMRIAFVPAESLADNPKVKIRKAKERKRLR